MKPPFEVSVTGNSGHAEFGKKVNPALKASTTYFTSIDAKCTNTNGQQGCNTSQDCHWSATFMDAKTDDGKNPKFDAVSITK